MYEYFVSWVAPVDHCFGQCSYSTSKRIKTGDDVVEMRRAVVAYANQEVVILNFILLDGDRQDA